MALSPIEILINARDNASGVFDKLNNKLKVIGVAIVGYFGIKAFAGVVQGAADFEQALSRVKSATGASADEMERLKKAAEDAGSNTKYTSTEAAAALENLAKAGLSAGDAIETLPAVLALAQAGDIELATASEYVTKAVMGMGLSFSDAARVADVLALGANATNTSVEGLAQGLSYAAPTAQSLGVSLESTVAIMGKFADAGIDASRAGTALNSIMSQFSDPASKFRTELAALGITTNDFEKALHQLAGAGSSGSKAINAVGLDAGPALKALLNQGMPALDELKAKLDNAAGSAAETARVMGDNLRGSMGGLASAWETVTNVLGTPVLPVLKDGVDKLAAAFRAAVADGTVQKFGEAIATAFHSAITWIKAFAAEIDFTKLTADLQAFAARTGEVFAQIGTYAANAGNIVQTAYGVMSAGTNAVLTAVYGVGSAFAGVASNIQSGLALIYDAFAKVTFGDVSAAYKLAADEIRLSAEATMAVSEALGEKSRAAFIAVADGAQLAVDGFTGLSAGAAAAGVAVAAAVDVQGAALAKLRAEYDALANGGSMIATADKLAQITALLAKGSPEAQAHAASLTKLRAEYDALVAAGNIEAARAKLAEMGAALKAMEPAAAAAAKALAKVDAVSVATKASAAEHAAAIAQLRAEYAALVASGNWQLAAEKMQQINAALRETPGVARDAAAAVSDAAAAIAAAYKDLSITTDAELRATAERAKGNFDLLASSGTASARELGLAFADAAKKAIDANNGIAPSWVNAQAGARGYRVEVDAAGQASVQAMKTAGGAIGAAIAAHGQAVGAAGAHATSVDGVARAYGGAGAAADSAAGSFAKANAAAAAAPPPPAPAPGAAPSTPTPAPTNGKDLKGFSSEAQKKKYSMSEPEPPKEKKTGGDGTAIPVFDTLEELEAWMTEWRKNFQADNNLLKVNRSGFDWYQSMMNEAYKKAVQSTKSRIAMQEAAELAAANKKKKNTEQAGRANDEGTRTKAQPSGASAAKAGMASPLPGQRAAPLERLPAPQATYISNVNIQGVGQARMEFADAKSQSATEEMLRKLVQAKGAAIR